MEISPGPGRLMGAFNAGVADEAWGDLPMPLLSNPPDAFLVHRARMAGLWLARGGRGSSQRSRLPCHPAQESAQVNGVYRDDWQARPPHAGPPGQAATSDRPRRRRSC
jgi:hypothetical protein